MGLRTSGLGNHNVGRMNISNWVDKSLYLGFHFSVTLYSNRPYLACVTKTGVPEERKEKHSKRQPFTSTDTQAGSVAWSACPQLHTNWVSCPCNQFLLTKCGALRHIMNMN